MITQRNKFSRKGRLDALVELILVATASALLSFSVVRCAEAPPPPTPTADTSDAYPTPSATPSAGNSVALYDVSNLGASYASLINTTALSTCKDAGHAYLRTPFGNETTARCSKVRVESGWCNFTSIAEKFSALGSVTFSIRGIPDLPDVQEKTPSELMQTLESAGWLPDQCATNDGREGSGGSREPVAYFYRIKKASSSGGGDSVQFLPICLSPPQGATWTYKVKGMCEI